MRAIYFQTERVKLEDRHLKYSSKSFSAINEAEKKIGCDKLRYMNDIF